MRMRTARQLVEKVLEEREFCERAPGADYLAGARNGSAGARAEMAKNMCSGPRPAWKFCPTRNTGERCWPSPISSSNAKIRFSIYTD